MIRRDEKRGSEEAGRGEGGERRRKGGEEEGLMRTEIGKMERKGWSGRGAQEE
jgi:hypothetical protein